MHGTKSRQANKMRLQLPGQMPGDLIFELGSDAAAIGSGNYLEIMSTRVFKVSSAPSVIGIDLVRPVMMGICPERKPALPDAPENFVKLHFAHQKRVMLRRNFAVSVVEIQSDLIIHLHRQERSKGSWSRKPENFNKKSRGRALVARMDDGMVKFNAHIYDSSS